MWFCIYIVIVSLIIGIIFFVLARRWVIEHGLYRNGDQTNEGEATIMTSMVLLSIVIPVIIEIVIIYGYMKSFDDSIKMLTQPVRS